MAETKRRALTTGKYTSRKELVRAVWDLFYGGETDAGIAREVAVSSGVVVKILRNGPRLRRRAPDAAKPTTAEAALPEPVVEAPPVGEPVYPLAAAGREVVDAEGVALATAATEALAVEVAFAMNLTAPMTKDERKGASALVAARHLPPESAPAVADEPERAAVRGGRRAKRNPAAEPKAEPPVGDPTLGKAPAKGRIAKGRAPEASVPAKAAPPARRRRAAA